MIDFIKVLHKQIQQQQMNVNIGQPQNESAIKRQLRQRRATLDNQQFQTIKPFMSHRKPKFEDRQNTQCLTYIKDKQNLHQAVPKFKRQVPLQMVDQNRQRTQNNMAAQGYVGLTKQKAQIAVQSAKKSLIVKNVPQNISTIHTNQADLFKIVKPQVPLKLTLKAKRKQVESIIFDSKVTQFQSLDDKSYQAEVSWSKSIKGSHLQEFQLKANKVNQEIQSGLSKIQDLIKVLKVKKQQKSQIKSQVQKRTIVKNLQRQFAERRALLKTEQPEGRQAEVQTKLKNDSIINPMESQIQLQGDFKTKAQLFPPQYITFISRLTRQIEKDIDFTAKINELTKANHITEIKELINNEISKNQSGETYFDQSFFKIQPSQLDPLDQSDCLSTKQQSKSQMESQAIKIFKRYKEIQTHYNAKLFSNFQISTIQLLFQELSHFNFTKLSAANNRSVTIGHLLSYLNMRTNKNFRNRSFVKMLKRLNLKTNGLLTLQTLKPLIKF